MPLRIYPPPSRISGEVENIHEDVVFPDSHPRDPELPYVAINMVSSLDGKVAVEGKSGSIGSPLDREVMRTLRSKADAVMIGAGTLRSETASLTSEGRKSPEPLAIIASKNLDLPLENLKDSPPESTIILTGTLPAEPEEKPQEEKRERLERLSGFATVLQSRDLKEGLKDLKHEFEVDRILLEGGPNLNGSFFVGDFVCEIFMTLSSKILSGDSFSGIVSGDTLESPQDFNLRSIHHGSTQGGFPKEVSEELFMRYRRKF